MKPKLIFFPNTSGRSRSWLIKRHPLAIYTRHKIVDTLRQYIGIVPSFQYSENIGENCSQLNTDQVKTFHGDAQLKQKIFEVGIKTS